MKQNYPNPFNTFTDIGFELNAVSEVILDVYDTEGRKVRTLVQGKDDEGPHIAKWDGRDDSGRRVSSGMYLCRLQVKNGGGRAVETIKILHIR